MTRLNFQGVARLDRRTKDLVKRLDSSAIAIIDHQDIDTISAEELVESGVKTVLNSRRSSTGRYPNAGPGILTEAGVTLVDVDEDLFELVRDGDVLIGRADGIFLGEKCVARGKVLAPGEIQKSLEQGRREIGKALSEFADNTMAHIREEIGMLSGAIELPTLRTSFRDRHALVVVRGHGYKRDLRVLKPYIRDVRPILIGVDGGGDALLEAGMRPDMVVGDMDSASDKVLSSGPELVVHAYPDGRAPGRERLESLGLDSQLLPAPGTSQDIAMLIAFEKGASLIVSVGSHFNLIEFLDKDRSGMSSTFLTRLRIGETLVDAKGVSRLYRPTPGRRQMAAVLAAALFTSVIVVLVSPPLGRLAELFWLKVRVLLGV